MSDLSNTSDQPTPWVTPSQLPPPRPPPLPNPPVAVLAPARLSPSAPAHHRPLPTPLPGPPRLPPPPPESDAPPAGGKREAGNGSAQSGVRGRRRRLGNGGSLEFLAGEDRWSAHRSSLEERTPVEGTCLALGLDRVVALDGDRVATIPHPIPGSRHRRLNFPYSTTRPTTLPLFSAGEHDAYASQVLAPEAGARGWRRPWSWSRMLLRSISCLQEVADGLPLPFPFLCLCGSVCILEEGKKKERQ